MTVIRRNVGTDIALNVTFHGPPEPDGSLGPAFDISDWTVEIGGGSPNLLAGARVVVLDAATGSARLRFANSGDLGEGVHEFRLRLSRDADSYSAGFTATRIVIGSFNAQDFDTEPPFVQLSGKDGLQAAIAPAEAELIFGEPAPAPTNQLTTSDGEPFFTSSGEEFVVAA